MLLEVVAPPRPATRDTVAQAAMPTPGHRQTPTPLPTLLQPPRSGSLARCTSSASTWSSGALPRPPGPSCSPELIPATEGPPALREVQAGPGLHPPPLTPPSHPVGPAPAEAEARPGAAGRGRERLAPGWSTPRPHALYLRGALLPPPRRLRSASVRRAPSPRAHAYLARHALSRGLQIVRAPEHVATWTAAGPPF